MASNEEPLTARTAAETIGRLEGVHAAMERRTSGLTWMVWGLATPAIFLSYGFAGAAGAWEESATTWWATFLWVPWVAMGVAATIGLWRSVGLVVPTDHRAGRRGGILFMLLFLGFIFLGFTLRETLQLNLHESSMVLLMVGAANVTIGSFGSICTDRVERALWIGTGVALAAMAGVTSAVFGPDQHSAVTVTAAASVAVAYFGSGLYQVTRG
jgi:hypothetical protein